MSSYENIEKQEIGLNAIDKSILETIFHYTAETLTNKQGNLEGSLITASGLEKFVDGGINWNSDIFTVELVSAPNWLRELLIQYWANRADLSGVVADDDEVDDDSARRKLQKKVMDQAIAVSVALRTYCGENIRDEAENVRRGLPER